jgi:F-type H+-transporting ATPase subunit alpha
VAILWAVQNSFMDDVAVEKIKDFQARLTDFLTNRKADLVARIEREKAISDPLASDLKAAVVEFKQTYQ